VYPQQRLKPVDKGIGRILTILHLSSAAGFSPGGSVSSLSLASEREKYEVKPQDIGGDCRVIPMPIK
jgi:hypothetical protein